MSVPDASRHAVRVDPRHVMHELMTSAVARLSGCIRVEIQSDVVRLTGSTGSWHEKQLAQECLRPVCSSMRIQNEITVPAWDSDQPVRPLR